MRAYHFLDADHAIDDIKNKRLKISRISDLNDPFELLSIELSDKKLRQVFLKTKSDIDAGNGVLCFSRTWSNPVLWSHYADKHRGICLGFDIHDDLLMRVRYDGKRLIKDIEAGFAKGEIDEEFMKRLLSTKYKDWEYEDEVRVYASLKEQDEESGLYFKDFDDALVLKEIILGARYQATPEKMDLIIKNCGVGARLIQARLAFRSFRIIENKLLTKKLLNKKMHRTR